jgi:glyoxylase I family protein
MTRGRFSPPIAETPFHHIALKVDKMTQEEIEKRIKAAGYKEPDTFVLEHGYCRSVYIKDPNGMLLEFTLDAPNADQIAKDRKADAQTTLKRWLGATARRTTFIGRSAFRAIRRGISYYPNRPTTHCLLSV